MQELTNKVIDLFLFIGQSNMAGRGDIEAVPALIEGAGYEYRAVSAPNRLFPVTEPFGAAENEENLSDTLDGTPFTPTRKSGSLVTAFVNSYYSKTEVPIVAVSASKGGTSIEFWTTDDTTVSLYQKRYADAFKYLTKNGYNIRHQFAVFCQGETNGDMHTSKDEYKKLLTSFLHEKLEPMGIEHVFLIKIGHYNGNEPLDYSQIQSAQEEICQSDTFVTLVSEKFSQMKARGLMRDEYHYYQQAYNEVGEEAGCHAADYLFSC